MQADITDGHIRIRPYVESDAALLYEAARECLLDGVEWMPWIHAEYSLNESKEWIEASIEKWASGLEYNFAIMSAATDEYLGGVGLNRIDAEFSMANLGYWVRKSRRGHGIAAAAAQLTAEFGFNQLNMYRIEIVVAVENMASRRTAEKAGAIREGILRGRLKIGKKQHDAVMHSFIQSDFGKDTKGNVNS